MTRREQEAQEDREARLDRQRLRTNHLTPGQRWVPQLVINKYSIFYILLYYTSRGTQRCLGVVKWFVRRRCLFNLASLSS